MDYERGRRIRLKACLAMKESLMMTKWQSRNQIPQSASEKTIFIHICPKMYVTKRHIARYGRDRSRLLPSIFTGKRNSPLERAYTNPKILPNNSDSNSVIAVPTAP